MLRVVQVLLGMTLLYTGFLSLDQGAVSAMVLAIVGMALLVKPAMSILPLLGLNRKREPQRSKGRRRKSHLTIVESDKNKPPTYH